uniref:Uncharacterized protein LOC105039750 n=1 Tax=Elaeis guineensis var. tenera TaxID=51953 RepID=A0A6I9QSB5_ELAGV|nr:uncharacterized protein LOC105039750 [Elaeis guineensis]
MQYSFPLSSLFPRSPSPSFQAFSLAVASLAPPSLPLSFLFLCYCALPVACGPSPPLSFCLPCGCCGQPAIFLPDKKRPYDPFDHERIDKVEFWVVEEDPELKLDYKELEEMLNQGGNAKEGASSKTPRGPSNMVQIGYIGFEEVLNTALTKVGNCLQFSSSWPCGQTLKDWVKDMCGNKCRRGINNEASPLGGTTMSACSYCKGKDPWVSLPKVCN